MHKKRRLSPQGGQILFSVLIQIPEYYPTKNEFRINTVQFNFIRSRSIHGIHRSLVNGAHEFGCSVFLHVLLKVGRGSVVVLFRVRRCGVVNQNMSKGLVVRLEFF